MSKIKIQDNSGDKNYFTIIPNYILNHSTIWDREVYIQMKRIAGEEGICWTSQKKLSKQCGISVNRLKKSIKYLLEHKWIKKIGTKQVETQGGTQEINEYKIIDLWRLNSDFYQTKQSSKGVSPDDIPTSKGVSPDDTPTPQRGITDEAKGVSPEGYKEEHKNNIPLKKEATQALRDKINTILGLFKVVNPSYERLFMNKTQRAAVERLVGKFGEEKIIATIQSLPAIINKPFAPKIITPLELERDLGKLIIFYNQEKSKVVKNKYVKVL